MENKVKSGISLIVLVITILVLAILAATVIISLSNTNVISETNQTTFKQDMASYKEAYELYVANKLAENPDFDRSSHNVTFVSDEYEKIFGSVPDKYKDGLTVVKGKLVYVTDDETEKAVVEDLNMKWAELIGTEKETVTINGTEIERSKYIGYYADVDGDNTVDGVIFADLAYDASGQWYNKEGAFEYNAVSGLKNYEISQASYTATGYGSKPVLKATGIGADRFYVMSLNDFKTTINGTENSEFYWYKNLSSETNEPDTSTDFETGKQNTENMILSWTSDTENTNLQDVWGVIQEKVEKGWFVPSKAEWGAFGYAFDIKSSNRETFGLSDYYWSSSYGSLWYVNGASFTNGRMIFDQYSTAHYIRLATTF